MNFFKFLIKGKRVLLFVFMLFMNGAAIWAAVTTTTGEPRNVIIAIAVIDVVYLLQAWYEFKEK